MNVMIVTDTFPPDINGVARTLQTLSRGLAQRGHQVVVLTTTDGALQENAAHGVIVETVAAVPLPGYDGIRVGLVSRRQISELISKYQIQTMYVAVETLMGWNAVRAACQAHLHVISGFHTNFHTYSQDYRVPLLRHGAEWYLKLIHNRTARTLTPSESTAAQLREIGIENVGVLGRGVDTALFHPGRRDLSLRQSWGATENTPVALFVGRIAAEKNLPLAVRAFHLLQEKHPGLRAVFVGDGPLAASLKEEHPEFIHAGARRGEDLARHYASADLFIFPSLSETFGNVLTEALASGLVTVSFDYAAAHQHIRPGENGFRASFGDAEAYLQEAERALTCWDSPSLKHDAVATAAGLSWQSIVQQFEQELTPPSAASAAPLTLSS